MSAPVLLFWIAAGVVLAAGLCATRGAEAPGVVHVVGPAYGPEWHAALCIGFDLVVAGGLLGVAGDTARARTADTAGIHE